MPRCRPNRTRLRDDTNRQVDGVMNSGPEAASERYNSGSMLIQHVFTISCPTCHGTTVLPRRSLLGIFVHPECQPTDIWPITYLCPDCGQLSVQTAEMIHQEGVEAQGRNLQSNMMVCHEFDREGDGAKMRVFSRVSRSSPEGEIFGRYAPVLEQLLGRPRLVRSFRID